MSCWAAAFGANSHLQQCSGSTADPQLRPQPTYNTYKPQVFLDFIPIFFTSWLIGIKLLLTFSAIGSPFFLQPCICGCSGITYLQRCSRAEEVSEAQIVESFLGICYRPRLRNRIMCYQGFYTVTVFPCSYKASFMLYYNSCKSVWVMRLYYFQEKDVSSFGWSTDLCVFISYSFCLIHKGSKFGTVDTAKGVTAVMIAQSSQAVSNSTDNMVMLALAITLWVNSTVPGEFTCCHQSFYCGVFAATTIYSKHVPSDSLFCWKAKPGCKDSCFPKCDTQCEHLNGWICSTLLYTAWFLKCNLNTSYRHWKDEGPAETSWLHFHKTATGSLKSPMLFAMTRCFGGVTGGWTNPSPFLAPLCQ